MSNAHDAPSNLLSNCISGSYNPKSSLECGKKKLLSGMEVGDVMTLNNKLRQLTMAWE